MFFFGTASTYAYIHEYFVSCSLFFRYAKKDCKSESERKNLLYISSKTNNEKKLAS